MPRRSLALALAAAAIPGAKLDEVPDCGHVPHLEAPERFQRTLLDFLR